MALKALVGLTVAVALVALSLAQTPPPCPPNGTTSMTFGNSGTSGWVVSQCGTSLNPALTLTAGTAYSFTVTSAAYHFLKFRHTGGADLTSADGAHPSALNSGSASFTPTNALVGQSLQYYCGQPLHTAMVGSITVVAGSGNPPSSTATNPPPAASPSNPAVNPPPPPPPSSSAATPLNPPPPPPPSPVTPPPNPPMIAPTSGSAALSLTMAAVVVAVAALVF